MSDDEYISESDNETVDADESDFVLESESSEEEEEIVIIKKTKPKTKPKSKPKPAVVKEVDVPKKKKTSKPKQTVEDEGDEIVEPPPPPPPKRKGRPRKPIIAKEKTKRTVSQAQLDALAKGRAKRDEGRLERKTVKQKQDEERKKLSEEKVVKKAMKIKKKEVIAEADLILSSEDDMDDLEIKQVKRVVAKRKNKAKSTPAIKQKIVEKRPPPDTSPQFVFY